jgi:hypothetical protein
LGGSVEGSTSACAEAAIGSAAIAIPKIMDFVCI